MLMSKEIDTWAIQKAHLYCYVRIEGKKTSSLLSSNISLLNTNPALCVLRQHREQKFSNQNFVVLLFLYCAQSPTRIRLGGN